MGGGRGGSSCTLLWFPVKSTESHWSPENDVNFSLASWSVYGRGQFDISTGKIKDLHCEIREVSNNNNYVHDILCSARFHFRILDS